MSRFEYVNEGPVDFDTVANVKGYERDDVWAELLFGIELAPPARHDEGRVVYEYPEPVELSEEEIEEIQESPLFQVLLDISLGTNGGNDGF